MDNKDIFRKVMSDSTQIALASVNIEYNFIVVLESK